MITGRPSGFPGEPQLENEWFRSYRMELAPGASTPLQTHGNPSVVVQVRDVLTHMTREVGNTREQDAMGDWAWWGGNSALMVKNMGSAPVAVVINEARR